MPTLAEILAKKKKVAAGAEAKTPTGGGLRITPESDKAEMAKTIKATLDLTAPKPLPPLPNAQERELGATQLGERIPMDHPDPNDPEDVAWFRSLHSFESELSIVIDPTTDHAWIAVSQKNRDPILLHKLPLLNKRQSDNPF